MINNTWYLASWSMSPWDAQFRPEEYTLPNRRVPPTPSERIVMLRYPAISALNFFNFVRQFGPVSYALWTPKTASVKFFTKGHTYDCVESFFEKGYYAAMTLVIDML